MPPKKRWKNKDLPQRHLRGNKRGPPGSTPHAPGALPMADPAAFRTLPGPPRNHWEAEANALLASRARAAAARPVRPPGPAFAPPTRFPHGSAATDSAVTAIACTAAAHATAVAREVAAQRGEAFDAPAPQHGTAAHAAVAAAARMWPSNDPTCRALRAIVGALAADSRLSTPLWRLQACVAHVVRRNDVLLMLPNSCYRLKHPNSKKKPTIVQLLLPRLQELAARTRKTPEGQAAGRLQAERQAARRAEQANWRADWRSVALQPRGPLLQPVPQPAVAPAPPVGDAAVASPPQPDPLTELQARLAALWPTSGGKVQEKLRWAAGTLAGAEGHTLLLTSHDGFPLRALRQHPHLFHIDKLVPRTRSPATVVLRLDLQVLLRCGARAAAAAAADAAAAAAATDAAAATTAVNGGATLPVAALSFGSFAAGEVAADEEGLERHPGHAQSCQTSLKSD